MEDPVCRYCVYYRQHYTFFEGKLNSIYCGHCLLASVSKNSLRPNTKACDRFEECRSVLSDIFVSKEYLTKALVEKVLSMELLPEIPEE